MKPLPKSRRYTRSERHAYGWKVSFRQSVRWPDGQITRHLFSDIGTDKGAAIWNALRPLQYMATNDHRSYCLA
jgi:hypothetical protein